MNIIVGILIIFFGIKMLLKKKNRSFIELKINNMDEFLPLKELVEL